MTTHEFTQQELNALTDEERAGLEDDSLIDEPEEDAMIAAAITEAVGPRCADHDPTCIVCRVWERFEQLTAPRIDYDAIGSADAAQDGLSHNWIVTLRDGDDAEWSTHVIRNRSTPEAALHDARWASRKPDCEIRSIVRASATDA